MICYSSLQIDDCCEAHRSLMGQRREAGVADERDKKKAAAQRPAAKTGQRLVRRKFECAAYLLLLVPDDSH